MVELYWSESESDIAWNEYIDFSVVCLHWVAMSYDKDQREFLLSRSLQYNSTLKWKFFDLAFIPFGVNEPQSFGKLQIYAAYRLLMFEWWI